MGRKTTTMMVLLQVLLLGLLAAVQASPAPQHFGIKSGIVGGQEAEPHQFPWQISLKYLDIWPHHYHTCGATIVDSTHIVCAAHCISGRQKSWFQVVAGAHNIHTILPEDTIQKRKVADMWKHEGYDSSIISACSGDSGGPFACPNENGTLQLSGIVSWGMIPCGQANRPSVFTSVGYFRDWIDEHLAL